jgi:hypothetical protein
MSDEKFELDHSAWPEHIQKHIRSTIPEHTQKHASSTMATRLTAAPEDGLLGLYGHTYIDDEGARRVQYQFQIIRKAPGDRYVVQYFSFMDSEPTNVGVMSEADLLGPDVKLYATRETWLDGYDKAEQRWHQVVK